MVLCEINNQEAGCRNPLPKSAAEIRCRNPLPKSAANPLPTAFYDPKRHRNSAVGKVAKPYPSD